MSTAISAATMRSEAAARGSFFFWLSVLLLSFLLIGFAPTLYFRAFTDPAPIPAYLHAHGVVLTSWYVWLVVQTSMVRADRTTTHRRLGVIGAAVVIAGPMATFGVVGRVHAAGLDWDTDMSVIPALGIEGVPMVNFVSQVVWANFASIVVFAGLLAAGILLRRTPQAHKRLIVLASIAIVGPALARISRWPVLGGEDGPFVPLVLVGLLLAVIAHDLLVERRLHGATWIGCGVIVLAAIAQQFIAGSELGLAVVRMMG
jgi:hypothetical protein